MITKKNSIYVFEGLFKYDFMQSLAGEFKGEMSIDEKGFFKKGLFLYDGIESKIVGHVKNSNSLIRLSFVLALDDLSNQDCVYDLYNITGRYNPITKNIEGYYVGKWHLNLHPPGAINPGLLNDYGKFEDMVNSAMKSPTELGGYADLHLSRKTSHL